MNAPRMKFHTVEVSGVKIEIPTAVRRRVVDNRYTYWLVRLEGIKGTSWFPYKNPDEELNNLIKALETSIVFFECLDPASRLHKKKVTLKSDQTLPVGVTGPFKTAAGSQYYTVAVPDRTYKVRSICVAGGDSAAREKAIALRKQGEASYIAARKAEAAEVVTGIKNLIRGLEISRSSGLK